MELFVKTFGKLFGEGCDQDQADLINKLGYFLWNSCVRDNCKFETQCCYIESYLNEDGKRFIKSLSEFIGK